MAHFVPTSGFFNHCFYSYNPKMFLALAAANYYEIIHAGVLAQSISTLEKNYQTWAEYDWNADRQVFDMVVEIIYSKGLEEPFRFPYDTASNDSEITKIFNPPCSSLR